MQLVKKIQKADGNKLTIELPEEMADLMVEITVQLAEIAPIVEIKAEATRDTSRLDKIKHLAGDIPSDYWLSKYDVYEQ